MSATTTHTYALFTCPHCGGKSKRPDKEDFIIACRHGICGQTVRGFYMPTVNYWVGQVVWSNHPRKREQRKRRGARA